MTMRFLRNVLTLMILGGTNLLVHPAAAQTYISAEPIPSQDIVGSNNLNKILGIGYSNLELWSERLLSDCNLVGEVVRRLEVYRATKTILPFNTQIGVAAGGFQAVTDPSYVLRFVDSGPAAASQADIFVLDNALGYVLNQGSTAQFSLKYDAKNPNTFPLDYAVVSFKGNLTGEGAMNFFNYLGKIDPALWSGDNAGFTQIALREFGRDNSMLFLIGNVSTQEFVAGLSKAASMTQDATYSPLDATGKPTTATAGAAFPGNDWVMFPSGDGYLSNLGTASPQLLKALATLRQKHLQAVNRLLAAIGSGTVDQYLRGRFTCP